VDKHELTILFVTSHCPFAPAYGTQLRILNIARQLKRIGHVSFVVTDNYERELDAKIAGFEFEVRLIAQLARSPRRRAADWVRHELMAGCVATEGFQVRDADRQAISHLIAESDVCWVHGLQTANMFGIYQWPRSILDIDDVPSRLFASRAHNALFISEKLVAYRKALLWWRRERILRKRFSLIAAASEEDRRYLGNGASVTVVPNGFSQPTKQHPKVATDPPRIGFIGTLKWFPNRNGVEWFIKDVWPHVKREISTVRLRLVGDGSDGPIASSGPDIDGLGWVEDPEREIASWSAMIVPVRCGAGTRVKIVEAFSKKCPVVSTKLGAFGYEVLSGEDILLADDPRGFASACALLLRDTSLGAKLSENAWNKFLHKWTWDSIGETVFDAVEKSQREVV
jgi:glycosyltransferase involved in cell wall biosynthesis